MSHLAQFKLAAKNWETVCDDHRLAVQGGDPPARREQTAKAVASAEDRVHAICFAASEDLLFGLRQAAIFHPEQTRNLILELLSGAVASAVDEMDVALKAIDRRFDDLDRDIRDVAEDVVTLQESVDGLDGEVTTFASAEATA